ncbi:hypothetical protein A3A70_02540 [candidate division WWE3 bacterium RIFCSPLOWO2_01_FULL_42_11]|uniref:Glycosyltransferase RgtA/B/C/D-like domain-containing protein n=1 Tax=candidate division WWE3 bacterium RIFCSPLOWO2_01_FULL_42_11 TaxID=1802627 RepID=A0A1F4VQ28_UNCKA|nr:MAG: hypothetical protein A3A70_02540 [candidate division WWE3 bacterium RIFCSPLOWO2_01_FULL_42_11]
MKFFRINHEIHIKFVSLFLLGVFIYLGSWGIVYSFNFNSSILQSEDALPSTLLPVSIIKEHDFYLDEYRDFLMKSYPDPEIKEKLPFYLREVSGHLVSPFPVANSILALPVYFVGITLYQTLSVNLIFIFGKISATLISALAIVVFYQLGLELTNKRNALILTLIFAFGTSLFSLASQTLWQHGTAILLLLLGTLCLVKTDLDKRYLFLSGLFFGLATWARPTVAVFGLILTGYVLQKFRSKIYRYIFGGIIGILPQILYNRVVLGGVSEYSYKRSDIFGYWWGRFPEGFLGLWLSPSKGLLIYSPILILSLIGIYKLLKNYKEIKQNRLYLHMAVVVLTYTLIMGKWYQWYGGYSYSYRMALEIVPFLILLMIPLLQLKPKLFQYSLPRLLVVISILIQFIGIIFFDGQWHFIYDKGPKDTSWLWSIHDSELMFYTRKGLCKLTSSDNAYKSCLEKVVGHSI